MSNLHDSEAFYGTDTTFDSSMRLQSFMHIEALVNGKSTVHSPHSQPFTTVESHLKVTSAFSQDKRGPTSSPEISNPPAQPPISAQSEHGDAVVLMSPQDVAELSSQPSLSQLLSDYQQSQTQSSKSNGPLDTSNAGAWRAVHLSDGQVYYYHKVYRQPVWHLPHGIDPAAVKAKPAPSTAPAPMQHAAQVSIHSDTDGSDTDYMSIASSEASGESVKRALQFDLDEPGLQSAGSPAAPRNADGPTRLVPSQSEPTSLPTMDSLGLTSPTGAQGSGGSQPAAAARPARSVPRETPAALAPAPSHGRVRNTVPRRSALLRSRVAKHDHKPKLSPGVQHVVSTPAAGAPTPGTHGSTAVHTPWTGAVDPGAATLSAVNSSHPTGGKLASALADDEAQRQQCPHCSRKFAPRSLSTHVSVCQRVFGSRRSAFDTRSRRVRNTPAESFHEAGPPCAQCGKRFSVVADAQLHALVCSGKPSVERSASRSSSRPGGAQPSRSAARPTSASRRHDADAQSSKATQSYLPTPSFAIARHAPSPARSVASARSGSVSTVQSVASTNASPTAAELPSRSALVVPSPTRGRSPSSSAQPGAHDLASPAAVGALPAAALAAYAPQPDSVVRRMVFDTPDDTPFNSPAAHSPGHAAQAARWKPAAQDIVDSAPVMCCSCFAQFCGTAALCAHLTECLAWADAMQGVSKTAAAASSSSGPGHTPAGRSARPMHRSPATPHYDVVRDPPAVPRSNSPARGGSLLAGHFQ